MKLATQANTEEQLENICEFEKIGNSEFKLDGFMPNYIVKPSTSGEVAKILKLANDNNKALAVIGYGTKFNRGAPLEKLDWVLQTTSLKSEPILNTDDLIVKTKAGVSLNELQNYLEKQGLFLPIDVGNYESTVGGLLGIGSGSSQRLEYGLIKDFVLGLKVALPDGRIYKFGGTTVKNVAGYDMAKLFIGSRGTLGVITDVCFRVYALPPGSRVFVAILKNKEDLFNIFNQIRKLMPAILEVYDLSIIKDVLKSEAITQKGYALLIKFTGPVPAVEKKYEEALEIIKNKDYSCLIITDVDDQSIWKSRAQYFEKNVEKEKDEITRLKIIMPPQKVLEVTNKVEDLLETNNIIPERLYMPYSGIAYYNISNVLSEKLVDEIKNIVSSKKSILILEEGPLDLRKVFYSQPEDHWNLKIKKFFDPNNILNAGKRP